MVTVILVWKVSHYRQALIAPEGHWTEDYGPVCFCFE